MKYWGFLKIKRKYAGTDLNRLINEASPRGIARLYKYRYCSETGIFAFRSGEVKNNATGTKNIPIRLRGTE